ncbi:hypothetical protein evm_008187, partial [Chilo suppressalis]
MSKVNRSGTREVIFKVFQRCFEDYQAGRILWDLDDVYGRRASMTGKSESRIVNAVFKNDGKFETPGKTGKADQRKKWSHKEPWPDAFIRVIMDKTTPFQPWAAEESAKSIKTEREVVDDAKLHRENVNHPKHTQTASYDKESVSVASNTPGSSSITGADTVPGMESKMDTTKVASMQQIVENTLSQEGRQRVAQLLEAVEALSGAERLLLYLRLPTGVPPHDPLKQPINPLGSRAELQQTVTWIQTHLEVDPDVSLPKQDVYDEYIAHCMTSNMKPLSTADFGKVMKQVYPSVRPRRLGTRGNSRYCYAGLRKKVKLEVPQLPTLGESSK